MVTHIEQTATDSELKEIIEWAEAGCPVATQGRPSKPNDADVISWSLIVIVKFFERTLQRIISPNRVYTEADVERFLQTEDVRAIPYFILLCEAEDIVVASRFRTTVKRILSKLEPDTVRFGERTRGAMFRIFATGKPQRDEELTLWMISACRATNDLSALDDLYALSKIMSTNPTDLRIKDAAKECYQYLIAWRAKNKDNMRLLRVAEVGDGNLLRAAGHQSTDPEHLLRTEDGQDS